MHADDLDRCFAIYSTSFDNSHNFQMEYRLRRADGEFRWVLDKGVPRFAPDGTFAGYIGSAVDITDLKRIQESDLARAKLESLKAFTRGIAQDFNNMMGGIIAQAELAENILDDGASPQEEIHQVKTIALRASEVVRELMIYSGQEKVDFEPVDLSCLVEEMFDLFKNLDLEASRFARRPEHTPVRGSRQPHTNTPGCDELDHQCVGSDRR